MPKHLCAAPAEAAVRWRPVETGRAAATACPPVPPPSRRAIPLRLWYLSSMGKPRASSRGAALGTLALTLSLLASCEDREANRTSRPAGEASGGAAGASAMGGGAGGADAAGSAVFGQAGAGGGAGKAGSGPAGAAAGGAGQGGAGAGGMGQAGMMCVGGLPCEPGSQWSCQVGSCARHCSCLARLLDLLRVLRLDRRRPSDRLRRMHPQRPPRAGVRSPRHRVRRDPWLRNARRLLRRQRLHAHEAA